MFRQHGIKMNALPFYTMDRGAFVYSPSDSYPYLSALCDALFPTGSLSLEIPTRWKLPSASFLRKKRRERFFFPVPSRPIASLTAIAQASSRRAAAVPYLVQTQTERFHRHKAARKAIRGPEWHPSRYHILRRSFHFFCNLATVGSRDFSP